MFQNKRLFNKPLKFPTHIAFIMDGNRRWATSKGKNKMIGHKQGGIALRNLILDLCEIKEIKYASFFAFSTENWKREQKEIEYIFDVAKNLLKENEDKFLDKNIKFVAVGDISKFPKELQDAIIVAQNKTKDCTGLVVNLALNYGGLDDIVQAGNKVFESGQKLTVENLKANLYTAPSPDIDLLIRTSNELRLSNFMLFQLAYSELYFTKTYWPDFDKKALYRAINSYTKRDRRFGGK